VMERQLQLQNQIDTRHPKMNDTQQYESTIDSRKYPGIKWITVSQNRPTQQNQILKPSKRKTP